jgi:hypothetical protein
MDLVDAVAWIQSGQAAAARRGTERDGGDAAAVSFWHLWMAELPFMADSGLGHGRTLSRQARQAFLAN